MNLKRIIKWVWAFRENTCGDWYPRDEDIALMAEAYHSNIDPWEAAASIQEGRPLDTKQQWAMDAERVSVDG